jgi:GNAT superfamily N-acetyltransferase
VTAAVRIRRATEADLPILLDLIDALADYEKLARPDAAARERLRHDAFAAEPPRFESYLVEAGGRAVGYAITFQTYSSFLALPTLFLEDVFVLPDQRRHGIGQSVMRFLAAEAVGRGCGRMEWMVLTWNEPAIRFYEWLGARRLEDWVAYRLDAEDLKRISAQVEFASPT